MRVLLIAIALVAGCVPSTEEVRVFVTSETGPVDDATVAIACQLAGGPAGVTDVHGFAELAVDDSLDLSTCTITTSRDGFQTDQQLGVATTVDVTLVEVAP